MTILYKSASGREVTHASSSSLDTFKLCRRKFKLSRKDGWRQKDKRASLEFGKCIESAVQYYHDNGLKPGDAPTEFKRLWLKWSEQPLVYTDQEGDWKDLYTMGSEMTRLYEILLPTLPIRNPKWQLQFLKKLWPGSEYDDLEFMAYIDLLSTLEDGTRIIVDIKTAKSMLSVTPGMMALDGQLRKYAWVSGIRDVGFLNFVKARPDEFKKGTNVSLLENYWDWKAGQHLVVVQYQKPGISDPAGIEQGLLGTEETVRLMDAELDKIEGKGSKEAKANVLLSYMSNGRVAFVPREALTKTRLQFVRGIIPEEDLAEIGTAIGTDMFAVLRAQETGSYPADGGVRFPNAICSWCEMRGICLKDDRLRDDLLVQIGPAVKEDDWLLELEAEGETE